MKDQLEQAQTVVLLLEFGLSMKQTATAIGTSIGWVCQLRRRLIRNGGIRDTAKPTRGGRRCQDLSREEEVAFLAALIEKASAEMVNIIRHVAIPSWWNAKCKKFMPPDWNKNWNSGCK
ncbi:hypothetical protein [Nitrosomonas communis]|uniref:hypothetical protein n=1 Tax=Nitrosomonas communis TaxID=44574 RepID=UPI003D2B9F61